MVGGDLQHLLQYRTDRVIRHLLQVHIGSTENRNIGIHLRLLQHLMEEIEHAGRVTTVLLTLSYLLPHEQDTVLRSDILTQQHLLCQGISLVWVTLVFLIGKQSHQCVTIFRFCLQNIMIDVKCFLLLPIHEQGIGIEPAVVLVVRILVSKLFHLSDGSFLIPQLCIEITLGIGEAFTLPLYRL